MKSRFILFRRAGTYYCEDTTTRKQSSLKTKDEAEAITLLNAKNESFRQPRLNVQIARAYLPDEREVVNAANFADGNVGQALLDAKVWSLQLAVA